MISRVVILLTLAKTKKLNAISPNPTAVNVNESTSPIKFTLTSLSLSSRAICNGMNNFDELRSAASDPFMPLKDSFLGVAGIC